MPEQIPSITEELRCLSVSAEGFGEGTALFAYVRWLNALLSEPDALFSERLRPIVEAERANGARRPFLSVITRTQGRRPEMLRETLLSLAAQTDEDYELLLIGHGLSEAGRAELDACLEEMPPSFRARTRRFELEGGGRAAPLNLGFAHARGEYAAVLDDDDLVFDDWVRRFHEAAREAPGAILHAYVVTQSWETLPGGRERLLRSAAAPGAACCADFELARQLGLNLCPLLGLAFPTLYFQKWGLCFDESLSTTEDWDYLMRLAPLAGVRDIRRPTGLYRLWRNAENSQTAHSPQEWQENYERIRRKFRETPMLFPAGSEKPIRAELWTPPPRRARIKARLRKLFPRPLWLAMKGIYRRLGGQKWLG